jgi:hypothetical protein
VIELAESDRGAIQMARPKKRHKPIHLSVELLESREVPSSVMYSASIAPRIAGQPYTPVAIIPQVVTTTTVPTTSAPVTSTPVSTTPTQTESLTKLETFDSTGSGALPVSFTRWNNDATASVGASSVRSEGSGKGLAFGGTASASASRVWVKDFNAADANITASVYLDSLIPVQVFARGQNLEGNKPTYYAVAVTRGLGVQLLKVVDGQTTILATVRSKDYVSGQWIRVSIGTNGDRITATIQRADKNQFLLADGSWSDRKSPVIEATDTSIRQTGRAGLNRPASYSGTVYLDNFSYGGISGDRSSPTLNVTIPNNATTLSGIVKLGVTATDNVGIDRVQYLVNNSVVKESYSGSFDWDLDTHLFNNGSNTLTIKAYDAAGNVSTFSRTVTFQNADAVTTPNIAKHYEHIRLAQLAYNGNPMSDYELKLLRESVDLVIPNERYLSTINQAAPNTPQLIYSNVSNLYLGLLTDWLNYADSKGVSRESAFYHVATPTAWSGSSPSSQPVNWFWNVRRGPATSTTPNTDLTAAARNTTTGDVSLGTTGEATFFGYTDKFREINFNLSKVAGAGFRYVVEYVSAVDATGKPTAWSTLTLRWDSTGGLTKSGQWIFDPPADWKASVISGSTARLFYVRIRVLDGTSANTAIATTIMGRDYVAANGGTTGTIPVFDSTADKDGDGYLNDTEFAGRKSGQDARFLYESRLFYPYYGQMRFVLNPSSAAVQNWAIAYHQNLLAANPLADGIFMDNSGGKLPFASSVKEATTTYARDYASLLGGVNRSIGPRFVFANTSAGGAETDFVVKAVPGTLEEFGIRALAHNWSQFTDLSNTVKARQSLKSDAPYMILDSLPTGGSVTDPRTQIATLAYYYLLGNPNSTFLMLFGGYEPATSWTRHFFDAVKYNVGQPKGDFSLFAQGTDPSNSKLQYKVMQRQYDNALVLYKPLSYAQGVGSGTLADATATTHQLNGNYRVLNADGTFGAVVRSVTLRNGEGAILIKA